MGTVQRKEDLLVLTAESAQRHQLAAHSDLSRDDTELQALAGDRGIHFHGLLQQHLGRVHRLLRQDDEGVAATKVAKFAAQLNPVLIWAIEDYFARGCPTGTAAEAALGLALHNAVPEVFSFKGCTCNAPVAAPCVHRRAWHAHLLSAAAGAKAVRA